MKNTLVLLLAVLITNLTHAQFIKEKSINAQIGFGISSPYESEDEIGDTGFFLQGEYVMRLAAWVELKPYVGMITTSSDGEDLNDNPTDEKAETKAFLMGGKFRVRAPIRWVAPYIELGIGASIGTYETLTSTIDIEKNGIIYHIPFAFGLELGRNNNIDLGFTYYFQPSVEQYVGAFAIGISIPLKNR
ncbi:hypothetical protein [Winogradskyella flava]|uniref:hypothetical protein n=1 Tax=Winogradskyella flava TaxID=1884876 RepID=UPI00249220DF|nr:hypothetical protein [Winogradskyella flava]